MPVLILSITGIIGLCLGSFVHLVIFRFSPEKTLKQFLYDISFNSSFCPNCHAKLSFLSLIPVISWFIQQGKCKYCLYPIPINYPMTECLITFFCIGIVYFYGIHIWSIILIILGLIFIILAVIDIMYFVLPNCFTFFVLILGLTSSYFEINSVRLYDALLGLLIGYLLLWIPANIYFFWKKQIGLGGGDIKLLSALGTWINYLDLPVLLAIASLLGLLFFCIIHYQLRYQKKTVDLPIPFGPCLLISAYSMLLGIDEFIVLDRLFAFK